MSLELLKSNLGREKEIIREMSVFSEQLEQLNLFGGLPRDRALIEKSLQNLAVQLEIVNSAVPDIINNVQFYKNLPAGEAEKVENKKTEEAAGQQNKELLKVRYTHPTEEKKVEIAIKKKDQAKFLESMALAKSVFGKFRKGAEGAAGKEGAGRESAAAGKPSLMQTFAPYIRLSNKFFRARAEKMAASGYFDNLNRDLRKITSPLIVQSYISIMLFSTALALGLGLVLALVFVLLGSPMTGAIIFFALPLSAFLSFYAYPMSERKNLEKEINQELPFVAIYMGAVATSGIEPSKIFEIIIRTKDYPFTQREMKKLLNYINFYGYDLVSALRYSAKSSPSEKLSLLFNGLAMTISSGGQLTDFLGKHAEGLLFDYRLEREKYTKVAETFMDIYISIVIAAPMIMMILFILIALTGYSSSIQPGLLNFLIIFIVGLLNVGFLLFLNVKQPKF